MPDQYPFLHSKDLLKSTCLTFLVLPVREKLTANIAKVAGADHEWEVIQNGGGWDRMLQCCLVVRGSLVFLMVHPNKWILWSSHVTVNLSLGVIHKSIFSFLNRGRKKKRLNTAFHKTLSCKSWLLCKSRQGWFASRYQCNRSLWWGKEYYWYV